jgi:hypothetical protein
MAVTITTNRDLARLVATELHRENPSIPADSVEDAEYYVAQGFSTLAGASTYDPATYAVALAREAVVEFAKNRLRGQPGSSGPFPQMAQRWMYAAAGEYQEAEELSLEIDPDEQAYA